MQADWQLDKIAIQEDLKARQRRKNLKMFSVITQVNVSLHCLINGSKSFVSGQGFSNSILLIFAYNREIIS